MRWPGHLRTVSAEVFTDCLHTCIAVGHRTSAAFLGHPLPQLDESTNTNILVDPGPQVSRWPELCPKIAGDKNEHRRTPFSSWRTRWWLKAALFRYLLLIPIRVTGVPDSDPAVSGQEARLWDTGSSQDLHNDILQRTFICTSCSQDQSERTQELVKELERNLREQWGFSMMAHRRHSPNSLALLGRIVFFLLTEHLMFYFSSHLEDLWVTLIRGGSKCLAVFSVNPKAPAHATIYWAENGYFCRGKGCRTSQLMPVNYLSPESNMYSLCQNYGRGESNSHTHTRAHTGPNAIWDISVQVLTNTHIHRCHLFLSVTVKNQTLHPSAGVIPSNKCHVAMVRVYPHEHVNQVPLTVFHFLKYYVKCEKCFI